MQHGCIGGERGERIEQRRQLFVLDLDQARRFFGRFLRFGGDRGHAIADVEHGAVREYGHVVEHAAGADARPDVGRRDARL